MKTIFLFLVIVMIPFSYSCSQNELSDKTSSNGNGSHDDRSGWSTVEYYYRTGPLPPPYYYEYTILINSDGTGNLKYKFDYSSENQPSLDYNLSFNSEKMTELNEALTDSRVLDIDIAAVPDSLHPIGGSLQKVKLIIVNPDPNLDQPPVVIDVPYFPTEEFKEGLDNLYEVINNLIPDKIWNEVKAKKDKYIKQHEDH
jgi:hypothetical protein